MNNRIKIAKQLIMLAKNLIADNIKKYHLIGFTKKILGHQKISFIYNKDDSKGSYIIFEKNKDNWQYSVYVNEQFVKEVSFANSEQAWEDLNSHINTYIKSFDVFLKSNRSEQI